ncbi:hypothetical protein DFJ73DRAFT_772491 [Zopfochytrium polystomum]|nr:hypothetical protein DFJ73DRAFT_772491 [Zopfochytrium polystomum]
MSVPSAAFRVPNAMATADGRPAAAAAATGTTAPAASAINANSFSLDLMQVAVTSLLHTAGFDRANLSATVVLADVAAFYLEDLARRASRFAEHQRRTDATFEDVVLALVDAHVDLMSFREYGAFVASSEKTQANDESAGVAQQLDGASATENAGGSVPSHDTANNYLSGPRPGPFPRPRPGMIPLSA